MSPERTARRHLTAVVPTAEHSLPPRDHHQDTHKDTTMHELLVDFITSLDGYASGDGWPGFWGLEGPEYLSLIHI